MWLHSLKVAQLLRSAACLHTNQSRSYLNHPVLICTVNNTLEAHRGVRVSSLSRLYDHTPTHYTPQDSSGRVIGPAQRPAPDNTQHSFISMPPGPGGGILIRNPSKGAAADPRLRQRGHWGRRIKQILMSHESF